MAADWTAISSLATAGGTLVLAVATFASVRSAKRSAQASERALLAGIRPVLVPSRLSDPAEKVGFMDDKWFKVEGGRAIAEVDNDVVYLAVALRNVGNGLAVLDRWDFMGSRVTSGDSDTYTDPSTWRRLTRDLYVPAGDLGFWQGAFREPTEPGYADAKAAVLEHRPITIHLLYSDHDGGQRTVSRFALLPTPDDRWIVVVSRHWNLDRDDPR